MNGINHRLFITVIILGFGCALSAQPVTVVSFPLEKDNKIARIQCLYKNSHGYILAGSDVGLFRFDGTRFNPVHFKNIDYTDTVSAIFEDRQLKTWVGFKNGRIAHIINNRLQYYEPEEGTPHKKITGFLDDSKSNTWFSTAGEGLYYLNGKHIYLFDEGDGMSDTHVNAMALASNGDVIACTDQGINICSLENGKKKVRVIGTKAGLPDYIITAICADGPDLFWLGLQDKGICLYDHKKGTINIPSFSQNWQAGQVNAILRSDAGLWIGTVDKGAFRVPIPADPTDSIQIINAGSHITGLIQDNQGNTWVSSQEFGLVRSSAESVRLMEIPGSPDFEHIHSLLYDSKGNMWLNNTQNQVIRLEPSIQQATTTTFTLPGVTEKTDITALHEDMNGNIWIGSMGSGLYILDPTTGKHRKINELAGFNKGGILSISGKKNNLYFSSLEGSFLIQILPDNKNIMLPYQVRSFDNRSIGSNYVYSIFEDSKGRIWFATDGNGLTMKQGKSFSYFHGRNILLDDHIYSITEDGNSHIWFSTASAGIYRYDGKGFKNYGLREGLSDLHISALKTINTGHIVVVHNTGLDILNPVTGEISYINNQQGIGQINAEDLGAVTLDTKGNIVVNTTRGMLTYFHPKYALQVPRTIIESVQLFLNDIDTSQHIFRYDENNFTFHFTGLYYSDPEKILYEYKLEGLDSSWIPTHDRSKNFPKLQPGTYTFRIRTALNKNNSQADEARYTFVIYKPFYKQWWFILLSIILAGTLLYWYIKNRERSLKKMERLRQEKIERQFEVLRTQVNPHFLFNSFNTLISTIEDDPKMAVEYAEQLSDFFRDIVNYRDKDTIPLQDEMSLLRNYYSLQQKRYGSPLHLEILMTPEEMAPYAIPPLTLQLLMENAIKHNAVSTETPLTIKLYIENNESLQVSNNINPRHSKQQGAGMGLQNIINRYSLLSHKKVEIKQIQESFIVSLPLIKT